MGKVLIISTVVLYCLMKVKPFKCDVTGNDKNYGFNVVNVNSTELVVFEAAIDLMSYVDIFAD